MENLEHNSPDNLFNQLDQINLENSRKQPIVDETKRSLEPSRSAKSIKDHTINNIQQSKPMQSNSQGKQQQSAQICQSQIQQAEGNSSRIQKIREYAQIFCGSLGFYCAKLMALGIFLFAALIQDTKKNQLLSIVGQDIQLACQGIFAFFLVCHIAKWKNQQYFWLSIDFISIVTGILGCTLTDPQISRYFKAIRTIKLLFIIKQIEILKKPASDLMAALAKVGNILIPALVIIYVYAVVGLYTFSDFQYNRCRLEQNTLKDSNWTVYQAEIFLCGQKRCPQHDGHQLQCLNPIDYDVQPNADELVNIIQGNGLLKYSNIFFAVLSTFKQTFVTGSSRLIILYKQVLNPIFIEIYFYSYIYLISYIYLNIFFSLIITSEWDGEKDQTKLIEVQAKTIKIQPKKQQNSSELKSDVKQINLFVDQILELEQKAKEQQNHNEIDRNQKNQQNSEQKLDKIQGIQTMNLQKSQTLVLKKTKIFNVFENVEQNDGMLSKASFLNQASATLENQNISLSTQFPKEHRKYEIINNIIIILCCVNLSLDFHGQSKSFKFIVDCLDFAFYILLLVQVIVKILIERYTIQKLELCTKFEIVILVACTCGVIYEAVTALDLFDFFSSYGVVQAVFRSFKYLRIMVLILRSTIFKEARLILESTFRSLYIIRHMIIVWFIIVITFGVIGFHLHSYKTKYDQKTGKLDMENGKGFQISFDGIFDSIIYTMLTFYNEEWDYIMFEQYLGGGALVVIWQLINICVGLLLFSKYFMALLMKELDNLIDQSVTNSSEQVSIDKDSQRNEQDASQIGMNNKVVSISGMNYKRNVIFDDQAKTTMKKAERMKKSKKFNNFIISQDLSKRQHCVKRLVFLLKCLIQHKIYKIAFGFFIISSCVSLTYTHPHVDRNSLQAKPFFTLVIVNKVYFIVDLFLNLMVYGLFQENYSYLRRSWMNWVNIVIIILEIVAFPSISGGLFIFGKLQKLQVLRIYYFLEFRYKHDWNMRITLNSFLQLLPKVVTLLIITLLMYSYFALILVKLYRDDFYLCSNYNGDQIVTKNDCLLQGGDWVQQSINVGNLFNSTLYLFYVATMEGWITLLYPVMNLAGNSLNPVLDANKYICIFFVFFFFFGNLIMLNVFIGLSVSNFKRLKGITTGQSKLSKKQKEWLSVKSQIYRLNPQMLDVRPSNTIRGYAYDISNHFSYKIVQGFFFCTFLIVMSLFQSNMSDEKKLILEKTQYFFASILIIQYFIQILAFGYRPEYKKSFIYKNIVVLYALVYIIVSQTVKLKKFDERILGGIFIALQFIRYLSLLDQIPFAKKLLNTIVSVLPQTSNILLMLCLTLFSYAIVGMELFAFLKPNIQLDTFNQNYTNFATALFALIKFSTLESPIQQISDAAQEMAPNFICSQIYTYEDYLLHGQMGCGNKALSYTFFLSFHVFYSMLLMSSVMAVIVDSYSDVKREEEAPITKLVLEKVRSAWAKIDPEATGYIPYRQFWMFTATLLQIYMGKEKATNSLSALFASKESFLKEMAIPIYQNQNGVLCFQFNEVIQAITRIYMTNNFGTTISKKVQKMFKERQSVLTTGFNKSYYTSSHVATLIILKSGLRMWKKKATNEAGRMQYMNVISKFNKGKNQYPTRQPQNVKSN